MDNNTEEFYSTPDAGCLAKDLFFFIIDLRLESFFQKPSCINVTVSLVKTRMGDRRATVSPIQKTCNL